MNCSEDKCHTRQNKTVPERRTTPPRGTPWLERRTNSVASPAGYSNETISILKPFYNTILGVWGNRILPWDLQLCCKETEKKARMLWGSVADEYIKIRCKRIAATSWPKREFHIFNECCTTQPYNLYPKSATTRQGVVIMNDSWKQIESESRKRQWTCALISCRLTKPDE